MKNSQWVLLAIAITLLSPSAYSMYTGHWFDIMDGQPENFWEFYLGFWGIVICFCVLVLVIVALVLGITFIWEQIEKLDE